MGMAPAQDEVKEGEPFVGRSGQVLTKILWKAKMPREDFLILNTIQCRPPGDNPDAFPEAIAHCKVHRDSALKHSNVRCIVALGHTPFKALTGEEGIEQKRGYTFDSVDYNVPVVGTYHPAYLGYSKKMGLIPACIFDIRYGTARAIQHKPALDGTLVENPSLQEFARFVQEAVQAEWVAFDIETPYSSSEDEEHLDDDPSSQILRASASHKVGYGISFPWVRPYTDFAKKLLEAPNRKVFWNAHFDVPRLVHNGVEVKGVIDDAMWLWHFLHPDLPRGLAHAGSYYLHVPYWKSESSDRPEYYSAMDAFATAAVYEGVKGHLRERGMWDIAERHVTQLLQVLWRMSRHGILIDKDALGIFQEELRATLKEIEERIDGKIPEEVKSLHPKNGYVLAPKDTTGLVRRTFQRTDKQLAKALKKSPDAGREVERWVRVLPFKCNGSHQVKRYMRAMKHPVPFSKKKQGETTEKKFLERYAVIYPTAIYKDILLFRKTDKVLGTYTNWPVGEDGRVHTIFTLSPATMRLSTKNPNTQNIPAEGPLADRFRDCIIAQPGYVLLRRDYAGIEAVLTGYFAGDEEYMKLAGMGVHAFIMLHKLGTPVKLSDPDIAEKLLAAKANPVTKVLYKKIKTSVHGVNFGLGPEKMFTENPGVFESKSECAQLRGFIFKLNPKIKQFQKDVVERARVSNRLVNPFGYHRWLWDIPGEHGPKAIAQLPQSTAAGIIKDAMLALTKTWVGEYMCLQIHDELVLEVPEGRVEECDAVLKEVMERPIPELGGLVIRTERKVGRSLR